MKTNLTCEASSPVGTRLRMTATSLLDPFPASRLASRESLSRPTGRWRLVAASEGYRLIGTPAAVCEQLGRRSLPHVSDGGNRAGSVRTLCERAYRAVPRFFGIAERGRIAVSFIVLAQTCEHFEFVKVRKPYTLAFFSVCLCDGDDGRLFYILCWRILCTRLFCCSRRDQWGPGYVFCR